MNKYIAGQELYVIVDDGGTYKMRQGKVLDVYQDGGDPDIYYYKLLYPDGTTATFEQNEVYDNKASAQIALNNVIANPVYIPALPVVAVGQEVYVVRNKSVRLDIEGISIEIGKVVATVEKDGNTVEYAIKLENPTGTYRQPPINENYEILWVNQEQYNSTGDTSFFTSYNIASEWWQMLISRQLIWSITFSIDTGSGIVTETVDVSENTEASFSLGTITGYTLDFTFTAGSKEVIVESAQTTGSFEDDELTIPATAAAEQTESLGSIGLGPTGGVPGTSSISFATKYNTVKLIFDYTRS